MPKVRGLTAKQRESDLLKKRSERIADGLIAYMNRNKLTQQELADEMGISLKSTRKLLNREDTFISITHYWAVLRVAGLRITEVREEIW
ncbi:MAG: hypothetical protein IJ955_03390 [Oscillospiraceae bacterium]|nr:hypothetical protein [Oscillospiraceae bacterium]